MAALLTATTELALIGDLATGTSGNWFLKGLATFLRDAGASA
jgi:hypothetical protein